jgi:hypothetical protein
MDTKHLNPKIRKNYADLEVRKYGNSEPKILLLKGVLVDRFSLINSDIHVSKPYRRFKTLHPIPTLGA